MLNLRTKFRCTAIMYKSLQNILKSNRAIKVEKCSLIELNTSGNTPIVPFQKPGNLINCFFMPRRTFATKASADLDMKELQRVYYGTLTSRMRAVKVFSLTTSLAGLAAQPILLEQGMKIGGTGMAIFCCGFAGFFTFVTPFLLHFVTRNYVTEIHYDSQSEEYVATTINMVLQKVRTKFHPNDVKIPEVPGMFTSFIVDKRSLFVDPALFENPEHYIRIMGYDKPIDFKLDLKQTNEQSPDKLNEPKK